MKLINDIYGQEVWSHFQGTSAHEFLEREDGFKWPPENVEVYFYKYSKWSPDEKMAIHFAKGRILDVGAGAGRVSLYLQQLGLKVTAIEPSPLAVKVCKLRGVKDARRLSLEKILSSGTESFETIVMFGNNFGLFENASRAKYLLNKLGGITSPEALILAQSSDPYKTRKPKHLKYYTFNRQRGRMAGQFKIRLRLKETVGGWFEYLFVSKKEMKDILTGTGWKIKRFFDSDQSLYSDSSVGIYTAVIEKEKSLGEIVHYPKSHH